MTPSTFLPPPFLRKIWTRILILVGYLPGVNRGFYFWDKKRDILYWNKQQCRTVFGIDKPCAIGTYASLFETQLWDGDPASPISDAANAKMAQVRADAQ